MRRLTDENILLHERSSRSSVSKSTDNHLSDIDHIKRQAYLVLEENKVLQDQLDLQTNRLNDVQKTQIQEGNENDGFHLKLNCFSTSFNFNSTFINC